MPAPITAAPGAGLPPSELRIARFGFGLARLVLSTAAARRRILAEQAALHAVLARFPAEWRSRRVLIERPRGLEDSSRDWSAYMTFDHLRIVNETISAAIADLLAGRLPATPASTATVKPSPAADASVLPAFDAVCAALHAAGRDAPTLRTRLRFPHPWFGPLDARGWLLLGALHLGLHRRQLELILAGLRASGDAKEPA
jgi:hypothetical protein